jgi:EAL domain-containing protein (putative c-di-GMP-specific phosphodiesterase class I)/DNA-binding response OmpR family regulator/GGDEF domain-containing protein
MSQTTSKTLLIADDDPSQLVLSEAALAGAGFMVHTVEDGEAAVRRYAELSPDCVILDVMMPKMSGIEACREIRQQAGNDQLPILMLTGRNDLPAISDAYAAGASDFAQKGMNPRLLVERVRFLLRDRELQKELRASRSKLLLAQKIARVGHWELDTNGESLHVSPMLGELLGVDAGRLARYEDFVALLDAAEQDGARMAFVTCATGNGRFGLDHRVTAPDGSTISLHQEADLVVASDGSQGNVVIVTLQDLTRLHQAEESVHRLSYFDTRSGLPNRRHMVELLAQALGDSAGAAATAVVAFRVHNFDRVLQAHGGDYANRVITQVARRMEQELERLGQAGTILWRADQPSVCRSADGELSFLLRCRGSTDGIAGVTQGLLEAVSSQSAQADAEYLPAISAGIALAEGRVDAEQMLGNAHVAAASASDPRSCAFFSRTPQTQLRRRLAIESSLRAALDRREMQLTFQPRVSLEGFQLSGTECFLRWDHPQFGTMRPDEFIAIAQESGIADDIGLWMIDEAARQMAAWRERYKRRFFISVSVLARQLRNPGLQAAILGAVARHGLPAEALQIEVSERSLTEVPEPARRLLEGLRQQGVRVGIEDCGTGHSSLGQLRRVAFNSMKLDPGVMSDLYTDPWTQGVTTAVLSMDRATGIRSVADGVDDEATLGPLRALGFDEIQGHCVAPPMKAREFEDWMERGGARHLLINLPMDEDPDVSDTSIEDVMKWANG